MTIQFDNEQVKQRTRDMVAFLKEKGVDVPLGVGYEATARFIFGANSWNHLSGELKKGPLVLEVTEPPSAALAPGLGGGLERQPILHEATLVEGVRHGGKLRFKYLVPALQKVHTARVVVNATISSSDGKALAPFSILPQFHALSDENLLALAASKWSCTEFVTSLAGAACTENAEVADVLQYLDTTPAAKAIGEIARPGAIQYVRAFRPSLLAKVLLLEEFGSFDEAAARGFGVREFPAGTGRWVAQAGKQILPRVALSSYFDETARLDYVPYYRSEADATDALLAGMLAWTTMFNVEDFLSALDGTSLRESMGRLRSEAALRIWDGDEQREWIRQNSQARRKYPRADA